CDECVDLWLELSNAAQAGAGQRDRGYVAGTDARCDVPDRRIRQVVGEGGRQVVGAGIRQVVGGGIRQVVGGGMRQVVGGGMRQVVGGGMRQVVGAVIWLEHVDGSGYYVRALLVRSGVRVMDCWRQRHGPRTARATRGGQSRSVSVG